MCRARGIRCTLWLMFALAWTSTAHAQKKIAVLEFTNVAGLKPAEAAYVPDLVRSEATRLPSGEFVIMTKENILAMLPPGVDLASCEGACEIETGRNVGADYVVSGQIIKFGSSLKVNMKLHETRGGTLIAGERASASQLDELEAPTVEAARKMFARLNPKPAGAPVATPARVEPAPSAGLGVRPRTGKALEKPKRPKTVAMKADPLGFIFFGPTIGLEAITNGTVGYYVRYRMMDQGLLANAVVDDDLLSAWGLATGLRLYFDDLGGGFLLGAGVEYITLEFDNYDSFDGTYSSDTDLLVPQVEVGYRWVTGNFMFDLVAGYGSAIDLDGDDDAAYPSLETSVGLIF